MLPNEKIALLLSRTFALLALIPITVAVVLGFHNVSLFTNLSYLAILTTCIGLFALADVLAGKIETGTWTGYVNVATGVAWLSLGLGGGLTVVVIGAVIAALYRSRYHHTLEYSPSTSQTIIELALHRMTIVGLSALAGYIFYQEVFHGLTPLNTVDTYSIAIGILCLVITYGFSELLGWTITRGKSSNPVSWFWKRSTREDLLGEGLLIITTVMMAIVLYNVGVLAFAVMVALLVTQIVRNRQIQQAEQRRLRHIQELAAINIAGQSVTSTEDVDSALKIIHKIAVDLVNVDGFYIALYDANRDQIDYRMAYEKGVRATNPDLSFIETLNRHLLTTTKPVYLTANALSEMPKSVVEQWPEKYVAVHSIPLMIGDKLQGMMTAVSTDPAHVFSPSESNVLETIANQASLAIRNMMLYDRDKTTSHNLSLINKAVQDVMFNLDSEDAMRAACETSLNITDGDKAAIFLINLEDKIRASLAQSVGFSDSRSHNTMQSLYHIDPTRPAPFLIQNVAECDDAAVKAMADAIGFSAVAEIPLRSGNTVVGYLAVYHDSPHYHQQIELDLLEALAYQITSALDNAELLKALELYASEQAQLVHLSRILAATLELETIIPGVGNALSQMLEARHIHIGLFTTDKKHIDFYPATDNIATATDKAKTWQLPINDLPEIEQLSTETLPPPKIFTSPSQLSPSLAQLLKRLDDVSLIVFPMVVNNEFIGVILFSDDRMYEPTDNTWRLGEMATNQVATHIHNAQIFTFTEEALIQRLQELSLIEDIAQQISRALEIEQIIHNVLESATRVMMADRAELALHNNGQEFRVIGQVYKSGEIHKYDAVQIHDQDAIGIAARTKQTVLATANNDQHIPIDAEYQSVLAVPLVKDSDAMGVLKLESRQPNFFRNEQVGFIKSLAGHATISIDNARMLEEREYQIRMLETLRKMGLQLSSAINKQAVINVVLETSLDVTLGQAAALYEYRPQNDTLEALQSKISPGYEHFDVAQVPADLSQILKTAIHTPEVQVMTQAEHLASVNGSSKGYQSFAVVPILRSTDTHHILCVCFSRSRGLNEREIHTLQLLAAQAAGHLENAMLHERIREGNDRMRAILDSTRDGIVLLDHRGILLEANPIAGKLLELDLASHLGENFPRVLLNYAQDQTIDESTSNELKNMARILRLQPQNIADREFILGHGTQARHIKEVASPVLDENKHITGRLLVFTDITEEKNLAEFRERLRRMVIHDLRGPVSSIITSMALGSEIVEEIQTMLSDSTLSKNLKQTVDVSFESANQLLQLVESLLDIGKLREKQLVPTYTTFSLRTLVDQAQNALSATIIDAEIEIGVVIPEQMPVLNADQDMVRRILVNLLHNALRFTPKGGKVEISARVITEHPRSVLVYVADSGPGIPEKERDRIFEEFEQIEESSPVRGSKGSGLGLTFCKLAIEAHGGKIWVADSGPLPGACFAFTLPLAARTTSASTSATPG